MEARVTERWVEDELRAKEALDYLDSLVSHIAVRLLLERTRRKRDLEQPHQ